MKLEKLTFEDENEACKSERLEVDLKQTQLEETQFSEVNHREKNVDRLLPTHKRDDSKASSIETDKDVDELVENLDSAIQKATENSKNEFDKKLGKIFLLKVYVTFNMGHIF